MKIGYLIGIVLLTGCVTSGSERYLAEQHRGLIAQGHPPNYVDGYVDGCGSGQRMAGDKRYHYRKNEMRAERDSLYARGWQEGQIRCRNAYLSHVALPSTCSSEICAPDAEKHAMEAEMQEIWNDIKK
jgi:hypothetical protein